MRRAVVLDMKIGDKYTSRTRTVTESEIEAFCRANHLSEDFFLSDEAGKAASLRKRVTPGAQTLVIASALTEDLTFGLLLVSMDKIKFVSPLYPPDTVHLEVQLLNKKTTSKGDRTFYTFSWVLKNQDGTMIAQGENTECTTKPLQK